MQENEKQIVNLAVETNVTYAIKNQTIISLLMKKLKLKE